MVAFLYVVKCEPVFKEYVPPGVQWDMGKQKNQKYSNKVAVKDPLVVSMSEVQSMIVVHGIQYSFVFDSMTYQFSCMMYKEDKVPVVV